MTEDLALDNIFHAFKDKLESDFSTHSTEVFEWMHTLHPTYNFLYSPLEFLVRDRDDIIIWKGEGDEN